VELVYCFYVILLCHVWCTLGFILVYFNFVELVIKLLLLLLMSFCLLVILCGSVLKLICNIKSTSLLYWCSCIMSGLFPLSALVIR
jgi:hypothetical protein